LYIQLYVLYLLPMKATEKRYLNCLYFTSNVLARKTERLASNSFKAVDLSPSYALLLILVNEYPGIQPREIAGQLQLMPSTITRLLDKLEKQRLIIRVHEGKMIRVHASPAARKLYPSLIQCMNDFGKKYRDLLGIQESQDFINSMVAISDKLKA
jgi:DNA-binding MarR family transcriptional regulator